MSIKPTFRSALNVSALAAAVVGAVLVGCGGSTVPASAEAEPSLPLAEGTPPASNPSTAPPDAPTPSASAAATSPAPAATEPWNVLVITVDAMRADMPWNGYPRDIAPNLTRLAKDSVVYTRAYSLSSYTAMSMGGFLAGQYPGELDRSGYFFSAYPETVPFFPKALAAAGVHTMAGHAHFYFDQKAGFRGAFKDYRMVAGITTDNTTDKNITSPEHLLLAKEMLGDATTGGGKRKPFFAWFHFMDPHDLYLKHEGYSTFGSGTRDRYDGEIKYTDHHVGQLLDYVKQSAWGKRTAIFVSADHGEAFGEHKMGRHGFELWEPLVRVPLIVHIPGNAARVIKEPRSHIDLAPTFFDLMRVEPPDTLRGESLRAEIEGKEAPAARSVIVDLPRTSDSFRRRALIEGPHKLIAFGDDFRFELYDVVADPKERIDLRHKEKDLYKRMKKRYLERVKTIKDVCPKMRRKLKGKRPNRPC